MLGEEPDKVHTRDVVIKHNAGKVMIENTVERVEVQGNATAEASIHFFGKVLEHVDIKVGGGKYEYANYKAPEFDLWIGEGCYTRILCFKNPSGCPTEWDDYMNTHTC